MQHGPFPELRYAYMRAIARAWNDEEFLMRWLRASDEGEGLRFLEEEYNFSFSWKIKFSISIDPNKRPRWAPEAIGGWWGFQDLYEMWLPGPPAPDIPKYLHSTILTRYNDEFPTMLGKRIKVLAQDESEGKSGNKRILPYPPPNFGSFGVTTGRLLAASWVSKDFAEQLFSEKTSSMDTVQLVQNCTGCKFPWNFGMKFKKYKPVPSPLASLDEYEAYWAGFPCSGVVLHVPFPPLKREGDWGVRDVDVQAVALAAYNDDGNQYPFTCA